MMLMLMLMLKAEMLKKMRMLMRKKKNPSVSGRKMNKACSEGEAPGREGREKKMKRREKDEE